MTDQQQIHITLDPSQHNYSAPIQMEQVIIHSTEPNTNEVLIAAPRSLLQPVDTSTGDDSDTDVNDKVMCSTSLTMNHPQVKIEDDSLPSDIIPGRLNQSISHHDYISSIPLMQKSPTNLVNSQQVHIPLSDSDNGLVIEEAVEEEISTSQSLDDEEEIVRSKPLTAMYLQRKDIYIPSHRERRISTPSKSPGSSKFLLKPSSRTLDIGYDDLNSYTEDLYKMRQTYGDPVSVYHPNTGEIHFKMDPLLDSDKKSPSKRSVEAILAASETIKNQDIASEVEIGTYEVEVSPNGKRSRRKKDRKGGIDDDIEQIRKAAKDVAYTLKGMNKKKDGRKRKKPRIRLTLTKAKSRQMPSTSFSEEEYESTSSSSPRKRGRKRKALDESPNIIYQCEYCEKQFKTREKVRVHTKIHTEERAFSCDICFSQYRRREHLVRHYRRHTNDRPYQCLECGKSYMRAEHLKRHSYEHTGEKPFECPVCPKAFTRHDRLIKHSLVHDK